MGLISKSKTFSNGTVPDAGDFNTDFDTIYQEFNGNIDDSNIKATANIAGTKLADGSVTHTKLLNRTRQVRMSAVPDATNATSGVIPRWYFNLGAEIYIPANSTSGYVRAACRVPVDYVSGTTGTVKVLATVDGGTGTTCTWQTYLAAHPLNGGTLNSNQWNLLANVATGQLTLNTETISELNLGLTVPANNMAAGAFVAIALHANNSSVAIRILDISLEYTADS